MSVTLAMLWEEGTKALARAGIAERDLDARVLLLEAFHMDMTHFLIERFRRLEDGSPVEGAIAAYRDMIARRAARIPLSQITNSRYFMGLDFYVDEHVLIPRQDTETLVEWVLSENRKKALRVLDLCAGSGCIGVSLSVLGGYPQVVLADISTEALKVAKRNAERQFEERCPGTLVTNLVSEDPWRISISMYEDGASGRRAELVKSDLFSAFSGQRDKAGGGYETFDLIVSNPPYIPTAYIEELEPEVKDHEPRLALDGREDGLYFYSRLAKECPKHLTPGGMVYFEIGYDQAAAVGELLRRVGFHEISVRADAAGNDRVVRAVWMG